MSEVWFHLWKVLKCSIKTSEKQSTTKKSLTQAITALSEEEFVNAYV